MNLLAAVFGAVALAAALLGFATDVLPILSVCGKVTALIAMVGLAITAGASTTEEGTPPFDFDADDVHG